MLLVTIPGRPNQKQWEFHYHSRAGFQQQNQLLLALFGCLHHLPSATWLYLHQCCTCPGRISILHTGIPAGSKCWLNIDQAEYRPCKPGSKQQRLTGATWQDSALSRQLARQHRWTAAKQAEICCLQRKCLFREATMSGMRSRSPNVQDRVLSRWGKQILARVTCRDTHRKRRRSNAAGALLQESADHLRAAEPHCTAAGLQAKVHCQSVPHR